MAKKKTAKRAAKKATKSRTSAGKMTAKKAVKKGSASKKKTGRRSGDSPVRIQCTNTGTACYCDGKAGSIFNCGSLGMMCLPSTDAMVSVTIGQKVGSCTKPSCDSDTGTEYRMIMNKHRVIGSKR